MKQKISKKNRTSRGFTLLLAALVASIALSLGSAIYSIVSKELALSSIGQASQYAFYAADTVAECTLFWDSRTDIHPNTFATSSTDIAATPSAETCDKVPASSIHTASTASAATTTLTIDSLFKDVSNGYCADVTIAKTYSASSNSEHTLITANGYNVPCSQVSTAENALQRTVQLQY
jgi:hypothetical protein